MGENVMVIDARGDAPGPFKMKDEDRLAARERSIDRAVRILAAPKPGPATHASINRNTGEPHQNKREIARRLRREQRAKGGAA